MYDIYKQLEEWSTNPEKTPIYLSTVTGIEGSAVRGAGATLGVAADNSLTGSVSGGCIESTVIDSVQRLRPKNASGLITFCPSEDPFMGAPSPCGGTVKVCIYPYDTNVGAALASRLNRGMDVLWGVCTEGPEEWVGASFSLDEEDNLILSIPKTDSSQLFDCILPLLPGEYGAVERGPEEALSEEALSGPQQKSGVSKAEDPGPRFFIHHKPPIPHALVVGGSHLGEALVQQLKALRWRVSVIDPREAFAPPERFSAADNVLHMWPEEAFDTFGLTEKMVQGRRGEGPAAHTAVAAVTHSEQIDDEAVCAALTRGCFYVGVLGSKRTFGNRIERLKLRGYSEEDLAQLHGPIGLDIGADSPEEIALAIAAQMVQDYRKGRNGNVRIESRA